MGDGDELSLLITDGPGRRKSAKTDFGGTTGSFMAVVGGTGAPFASATELPLDDTFSQV